MTMKDTANIPNTPNTITISFKKDEVQYLQAFKELYAVPTAIIKDFIINTVRGSDRGITANPKAFESNINNNDYKNNRINKNNETVNDNIINPSIDLLDF